MMYKRILVPVDLSDHSLRALNIALGLAKEFQSEVLVLNVMKELHPNWSSELPTTEYEVLNRHHYNLSKDSFDHFMKMVPAEGVTLRTLFRIGHPPSLILEQIDQEQIDLVVMGSHGYGPFMGTLLGSVSQRVMHKSPCSVLIVK